VYSGKITDQLLTEIGDKNWKVRSEALQKVVAIINEAKFITADIGSLPEALKPRITDSNKVLVSTLGIINTMLIFITLLKCIMLLKLQCISVCCVTVVSCSKHLPDACYGHGSEH
jgi:hypothetical protein